MKQIKYTPLKVQTLLLRDLLLLPTCKITLQLNCTLHCTFTHVHVDRTMWSCSTLGTLNNALPNILYTHNEVKYQLHVPCKYNIHVYTEWLH